MAELINKTTKWMWTLYTNVTIYSICNLICSVCLVWFVYLFFCCWYSYVRIAKFCCLILWFIKTLLWVCIHLYKAKHYLGTTPLVNRYDPSHSWISQTFADVQQCWKLLKKCSFALLLQKKKKIEKYLSFICLLAWFMKIQKKKANLHMLFAKH